MEAGAPFDITSNLSAMDARPEGRAIVLIPTYNEVANIRPVVERVLERVPADVLIIDDDSPDGTGNIADALAAASPRVFAMHRPRKSGLGRAYVDGMRWALGHGYDFVVQMDCDASHDPDAVGRMLARLETAHVVVGSRYVMGGATVNWPWQRRLVSRIGSLYSRLVLLVPQRDTTSGFKAWRADVLRRIDIERVQSSGYAFQIEMAFLAHCAGAVIAEEPIVFPNREHGESKISRGIVSEAVSIVARLRVSRAPWRKVEPLSLQLSARPPEKFPDDLERRSAA